MVYSKELPWYFLEETGKQWESSVRIVKLKFKLCLFQIQVYTATTVWLEKASVMAFLLLTSTMFRSSTILQCHIDLMFSVSTV